MIIDLRDIQDKQVEFISYLESKPGVINPKSKFGVTKGQAIDLLSELMEVCNAAKVQKWWDKSEINKEYVAEELADLLAHICNIANYLNIELIHEVEEVQIKSIEGSVLAFVQDIILLSNSNNKTFIKHRIFVILSKYIQIVYAFGFNIGEIKDAYHKKLKINYKRF
ncbi:Uncharacterized protein conserved in bacteria [uncultured Clostridium sp.]|nr:Uncharacterized protein conserved in bacteria [uncultured Clostridium sp.]